MSSASPHQSDHPIDVSRRHCVAGTNSTKNKWQATSWIHAIFLGRGTDPRLPSSCTEYTVPPFPVNPTSKDASVWSGLVFRLNPRQPQVRFPHAFILVPEFVHGPWGNASRGVASVATWVALLALLFLHPVFPTLSTVGSRGPSDF